MSDYPPTPSFGLTLSFAASGPSSSTARPIAPSGNRHTTVNMQKKPPVQSSAINSAQLAYQHNSNISGFNVPPSYQAPRLGQFSKGQIPPPPFPPLPATFQDIPVQMPLSATGSGLNPSHTSPPLHRPGQASNIRGTANIDYLMAPSDKEEGELSDREIERKSSSSVQETGMVVPQPTRTGTIDRSHVTDTGGAWNYKEQKGKPPTINPARDPRKGTIQNKSAVSSSWAPSGPRAYDGHPPNRHANMPKGSSLSPLGNRRYDQHIPAHRDNGLSYVQRSLSPQNPVSELKNALTDTSSPPHSQAASQKVHSSKPSTPGHCSPTVGKPYSEIRNLAKNAVLNLIPLKVEYKDFVNEGINEEVVKGLFEELRLRIPIPTPTQESPPRKASSTGLDRSSQGGATHNKGTITPRGIPTIKASVTSHAPLQLQASAEKSQAPELVVDENDSTPPIRKVPPTSVSTEVGAQSVNGSAEPKLSRAELIKQHLSGIESKKAKIAESVEEAKMQGLSNAATDREKDLAAEKEKKVKNELIRLRMEALKKSTSLKGSGPSSVNSVDAEKAASQSHATATSPPETPLGKQQAPTPTAAIGASVPFTGIPGLFMTSSSAPSNDASSNSNQDPTPPPQPQAHGINRRKRPVAADFEDTPMSTTSSFKRPFGRSRVDRPLVIEVSDDETADGDDDSDMDLDDGDGPDSDRPQKPMQSSQARGSIRDFPPLPDFPNKRRPGMWGSAPVSTMNTPPLSKDSPFSYPNGRGKSSAKEDLKKKIEQIELVRKKIAELEQKKAKPGPSRGQTPGSSPGRSVHAVKKDEIQKLSDKKDVIAAAAAAAAEEIDRLIEDANRQANVNKLAEAQEADLMKAQQEMKAKAEFEHQKQLRLAEIESGIPLIDAEVEKSRSKLEELRAETAKWEAAVRQGLEGKKKLMEELERLGAEESRASAEAEVHAEGESPQRDSHGVNRYSGRAEERRAHSVAMTKAVSDATEGSRRNEITQDLLDISNERTTAKLATGAELSLQEAPMKATTSAKTTLPAKSPDAVDTQQGGTVGSELKDQIETDTNLLPGQDANIPPSEVIQAAPHVPEASVESTTDANEAADTEMGNAGAVDLNRLSIVNSPEVEPASINEDKLPTTGNETDQEGGGEPNDSRESSHESDFYEPPEATHSPFHVRTSSSPDQARTHAIGLTNQSTAGSEAQGDKHAIPPKQKAVIPIEKPTSKEYFTPYISPLKQFRAYRYHRNYLKDVPGGFRSLTYSHNIDANKPLCMFETSGGVCNDPGCQGQHFRDMKLNDDMVLVHLGSVNEGHDAEEKAQYTEGLKQIIQNMRTQKVKDFSTVASQITGYRSRFLRDESRVLILDLQNQQPGVQAGGTS
ncbi:MAG: hypothetical protein M1840_000328 [Geoglossum simile]|nr:MAG: hypothetical protein M1840_000328 [Geoglossum simile]